MTKRDETVGEGSVLETPAPTLYGNENYVSDHRPRVKTQHTQEEWLMEAIPAAECLAKGDAVSPRLIEMLFLDALDVIGDFVPPAGRAKKADDAKR